MAQDDGPVIDFVETGSGANVLFVPGSYSTPAAWRPIQKRLDGTYRLAATSLCGYGATAERRTLDDCGMEHEVRVVVEAARRLAGPVHLVGHSFGGTVALAAALSGGVDVASLSLFEANPLELIRHGGEDGAALYEDAFSMSRAFEQAVADGEHDAPARIIDYWGGAGVFAAMPEIVQDYCRQTAPANVLDWRCDFGMARPDCATLTMPVLLVRGGLANKAMLAMTAALERGLPDARIEVVPDAGHFLISSHPGECAALLGAFLAEVA